MWKTLRKVRNISNIVNKSNILTPCPYRQQHSFTLLSGRKVNISADGYAMGLSTNILLSFQLRQFENEYKAFVGMLARSLDIPAQTIRQYHLSLYSNASKPGSEDNKKPPESPEKEPAGGSASGSGGPNDNKNDNDDKIKSVLTKTIMWMFTIYMFVAFISLILSPRSERPEVFINMNLLNKLVL